MACSEFDLFLCCRCSPTARETSLHYELFPAPANRSCIRDCRQPWRHSQARSSRASSDPAASYFSCCGNTRAAFPESYHPNRSEERSYFPSEPGGSKLRFLLTRDYQPCQCSNRQDKGCHVDR